MSDVHDLEQARARRASFGPPRRLRVVRLLELSPRMRRVTFGGAALADFPDGAEGVPVDVYLPRPGQSSLGLLDAGSRDRVGASPEPHAVTRTCSVTGFDRASLTLTIDFVLHDGAGVGARWAASAALGDEVAVSGPSAQPHVLQTSADYYVLAGDLSALPAMAAVLARLPAAAAGHALLEVPSSSDFVGLRAPRAFDVCWRFGLAAAEHPLAARVRALRVPEGRVCAWLAGEAGLVRALSAHFREERRLPVAQLFTLPLWSAHALDRPREQAAE